MDLSAPLIVELLARSNFAPPGTSVVCGVSGGPDSLALLVLAVAAGLDATAVHVDHGLRPGSGEESRVVARLADELGAAFRGETVEVGDGPDLEARARKARHRVLGVGALTGHTADDQAETVLINLIRGSGPRGLGAMTPSWSKPILGLRRADTHQLCSELGLSPVTDESNQDPRFQRNRIRAEVLPVLDDIAKRDVVPLINRAADHLRNLDEFVGTASAEIDATDTAQLRAVPEVLARAALRDWLSVDGYAPSSSELDRVWRVVAHDWIGCELAGGRRVRRTGGILRIE